MVCIKIKNNTIILECAAGVASQSISFFHSLDPEVIQDKEKCMIKLSVKHIDKVREFANINKNNMKIRISDSVHKWVKMYEKQKPLLIRVGPVESCIYRSSTTEIPHKAIEDKCKYFFKPAVNMKSYKESKWDGYYHLYQKRTRRFLTGLLPDVISVLEEKEIGHVVQFLYDTKPPRQFNWKAKDWFELSDDQKEAIKICKEKRRCTIKAATGFGKTSALARYLTSDFAVPTLFIANKKVLLDDAASDFANGIEGVTSENIAQIKDGKFGLVDLRKEFTDEDLLNAFEYKHIIVATIQSLDARMKDPKTSPVLINWLKNTCKFLMVDETQAVGTKIWDDVLSKINAPYRIFLSATPKRSDGASLKIFGYSGPLAFDTSGEEQIERGRLCELDIYYKPYDHRLYNDNDKDLNYQETYTDCIVNNEERNTFIINESLKLLEEERQILVLIQYIEHGHILHSKFLEAGFDVEEVRFIYGETPDKIRKETIKNFREGKGKVLIGSTIADVGLNIPSISGVMLCGAGNSEITHIQRIGRGARTFDYEKNWGFVPKFLNGSDKKITYVIDILDKNVAFFNKQAKNRYNNACDEFGADRVHLVNETKNVFKAKKSISKNINKASKVSEDDFLEGFEVFKGYNNISSSDGRNDKIMDDFIKSV